MSSFYKLSIQEIKRETNKSIGISFNIPENLKDVFSFKAGQYITLKTSIEGNDVRRDYSLCSSPKSGKIKVAVKEVENGTFSAYANQNLKAGDVLEVAPPKGKFTFTSNNSETKNIALFSAGSGITPVLSIIKCALEEETQSKIVLVYGNKTTADTMFLDELLALQNTYKNRFTIQFVFSQKDEMDAIFGRIEKSTVNYILKNKHKDVEVDAFYLCGPEAMIHTVKDVLTKDGVNESKIHFELFKAAKPAVTKKSSSANGESEITVIVDDETSTFKMPQKQTILEGALDQDIDAPYSCQGGICCSCLARVKEGEVSMRQNNILTESEVAQGLILTCQAQPISTTVIVDYDDV